MNSRLPKILTASAIMLLLLMIGGFALRAMLESTMQPQCQNQILSTLVAPQGKHSAILFARDCGATTGGLARHIALLPAGAQLPAQEGGFFVAVLHRDAPAPAEPVRLAWRPNGDLQITVAPGMEMYHGATSVRGVAIHYQFPPSPSAAAQP
ncbi:hypothetical protein V8J88_05595 [Massilia sp. W12]|uniref:hypothetical protein n=1 Tax=Massilia sp. W12 TaxID=3126507 RepID=UPI0030CD8ADF